MSAFAFGLARVHRVQRGVPVHLMNHRGGPSVTERQTLRQELQPV